MFESHLIPLQVLADKAAGFPSRSVIRHLPKTYQLVREVDYDRVLEQEGVVNHDLLWVGLFDLLWHADIWVAFFDGHFYPIERAWENEIILCLIRLAGIRIIMVNYGGDIITWPRNHGRYDWIGRLARDYPHWQISRDSPKVRRRIDLFCRHAAFVCNGDSSINRMMPRCDLVFKYFPADVQRIMPKYTTGNAVPRIIHAPQHRWVKGSDCLLEAATRLRGKGFVFDLELIEKMPHHQAIIRYADADIIADQFCIGAWGAFAQEGLALGKPVLTYLDQEHLGDPAFNLPLVNANPDNLERVLAVLLGVPELRERLGRRGRAVVEEYQSPEPIGAVWARLYRHVWWGEPLQLESTRYFAPDRPSRPFTEDPSDPAFWPVPVDDLIPEISAALAAAGFGSGANVAAL